MALPLTTVFWGSRASPFPDVFRVTVDVTPLLSKRHMVAEKEGWSRWEVRGLRDDCGHCSGLLPAALPQLLLRSHNSFVPFRTG